MTIHSDRPIEGTGSDVDELHRGPFVDAVANALILDAASPGLVVSLEAPWGFGKSSTLNLIRRRLEANAQKPIIFTFNPWLVGGTDGLVQAFLTQLSIAIGTTDDISAARKVGKELLTYSSVFDMLKFVPGAEPWASLVKGIFEATGKATTGIGDLKALGLEKRRDAVVKALRKLARPVVVLIDDIDRLPPDEVFQIVRVVKAVADFPRTAYVLAYDPSYIDEALQAGNIPKSANYLDKVIQVRLTLPLIDKDALLTILNREYDLLPADATASHFGDNQERLGELYYHALKGLLQTPRDIKRLMNRLRFIEAGIRKEVALPDLIGLETLALKAPKLYELIREQPRAFTGNQPDDGVRMKKDADIIKEFTDLRQAAIEQIDVVLKPYVIALVHQLFPLVEVDGFSVESKQYYESHGRVAAASRLRVALSGAVPSGEFSMAATRTFLEHPEKRSQIIALADNEQKLTRFLQHVGTMLTNERAPVDVVSFVCALATAADCPISVQSERHSKGVFTLGPVRLAWFACKDVLAKLAPVERKQVIETLFNEVDTLTIATDVLVLCLDEAGVFDKKNIVEASNRWIASRELDALRRKWIQRVETAAKSGKLYEMAQGGYALSILGRIDAKAAKRVLNATMKKAVLLDQFALAIVSGGQDSVKGRFAHLDDRTLEPYGGRNKLVALSKRRLTTRGLPGDVTVAHKAIALGKRIYFIDGSIAD